MSCNSGQGLLGTQDSRPDASTLWPHVEALGETTVVLFKWDIPATTCTPITRFHNNHVAHNEQTPHEERSAGWRQVLMR